MKAIRVHRFGGPSVMRLEKLPTPKPLAGQLVVRVKAIGVNPVDTYIRAGNYVIRPSLPYTPGIDAAGIVQEVGEGATQRRIGDRVYIGGSLSGSYAQSALCEAAKVFVLPDSISFSQGAAIYSSYTTAHRALFHAARGEAGESVLIQGASGGVGTAAVQIAKALGMTVIATVGSHKGQEVVAAQGAKHVLNHHDENHFAKILEITNGRGVDVVVEMLANINLGKDLVVIAPRGRIVAIGSRGKVKIDPRAAMMKDATIAGMSLFNATTSELQTIQVEIITGLKNGTLRPVVGREMSLSQAPASHRAMMAPGAHGKIILIP